MKTFWSAFTGLFLAGMLLLVIAFEAGGITITYPYKTITVTKTVTVAIEAQSCTKAGGEFSIEDKENHYRPVFDEKAIAEYDAKPRYTLICTQPSKELWNIAVNDK